MFSVIEVPPFRPSFVNVIINPFRIPEFKHTLFQILNFCVIPFGRFRNEVSPSSPGHFHHPTFTRKVRFYLLTFWSSFSLRQLQIEPSRTAVIQRVSVFLDTATMDVEYKKKCIYILCEYLTTILQPLTDKSRRKLQSTEDFINATKTVQIPDDYKLVSFDVKSLFTSIPLQLALQCI